MQNLEILAKKNEEDIAVLKFYEFRDLHDLDLDLPSQCFARWVGLPL